MKKRYRFRKLGIEITRKCNSRCVHCMRGDAQNITISEVIIDKIFEEVQDVKRIVFGSGEALLEVDKIDYFIDKLIESQWSTRMIEVTTNGILCERQIVDTFEKFCLWKHGRRAVIRISNDQYHDAKEYEQAYSFYKPLVDAANERIKLVRPYSTMELVYSCEDGEALQGLVYSGRAINYIENHKTEFSYGDNIAIPHCYKRRIKIIGTEIPCALHISANGNITFHEPISYNQEDDISIGNIIDCHLTDLIDKHNEECLVLCSEMELIYQADYSKYLAKIERSQKEFNYILENIYKAIIDLRYRTRKLFSHIPAQTIIERLPFPDAIKLYDMVSAMYRHCPYYTENLIVNINKYAGTHKGQIYMGAMFTAVVMYIKDKNIARKYPYYLFGTEKDISEFLIEKFEDLDEYYNVNPGESKNNKVFLCEPGKHNIINYAEGKPKLSWEEYDLIISGDIVTKGPKDL